MKSFSVITFGVLALSVMSWAQAPATGNRVMGTVTGVDAA